VDVPDLDGLRGGGLLVIGRGGREEFINSDFALSLPRDRDNASLNDLVFLDLTESNMDNLHQLIEQLGDLRAQKKRLDYESRQITTRIETKEREIMEAMDNQEITESGSAAGKVSLGEAVYPQVTDWDAVYKFIHENEYYHCLEKRFAVLAYREILGQGNSVPGVVPFTKRKLRFTET
jgi:glucosamine 6-phosphate synthetase-like amidotransferase/phosphosugar isomerase protein